MGLLGGFIPRKGNYPLTQKTSKRTRCSLAVYSLSQYTRTHLAVTKDELFFFANKGSCHSPILDGGTIIQDLKAKHDIQPS